MTYSNLPATHEGPDQPSDEGRTTHQYPPLGENPELAGIAADYGVLEQMILAGALDCYAGQYVAILKGEFIGSGSDEISLQHRLAEERHVHPGRIAICYIESEDD